MAPRAFQLHLVDANAKVAAALKERFGQYAEVSVGHGDILSVATGVVVSPANSEGFMDGGIDLAYARFFGSRLRMAVRDAVLSQPEGSLPVGAAVAIPTGHGRIHHLILAPTMTTPEHVPAANAYRAFRAALKLMASTPQLGDVLFCPGMTTLVGGVEPSDAAAEMLEAFVDWRSG